MKDEGWGIWIYLGVRFRGLKFLVRVERGGSKVYDAGFHANWNMKYVLGVSVFLFLVPGFCFRVSGLEFRGSNFGFRISDFGF